MPVPAAPSVDQRRRRRLGPRTRVRRSCGASRNRQPSAEEALKRLLAGNERYVSNSLRQRPPPDHAALAAGQAPFAASLACADSRVAPELVFDQGPGELSVVRIAGNFVTDYVLASLEYAVVYPKVPLVMVMGHSNCGAVTAALAETREVATLPGAIGSLASRIQPALEDLRRDLQAIPWMKPSPRTAATRHRNLPGQGNILPQALDEGRLQITAALHRLSDGRLQLL